MSKANQLASFLIMRTLNVKELKIVEKFTLYFKHLWLSKKVSSENLFFSNPELEPVF